jgi:hypothetical protein
MKIQIDFDNKVIKLESNVNLKEFYDKIKTILDNWQEFSLHTNTVINWNNYPVYSYDYTKRWPYSYPWWGGTGTNPCTTILSGTTLTSTTVKQAICNVEV